MGSTPRAVADWKRQTLNYQVGVKMNEWPENKLRLVMNAKSAFDELRIPEKVVMTQAAIEKGTPLDLEADMPKREQVDLIWRAIAEGLLPEKETVLWSQWIAAYIVRFVVDDTSGQEIRAKRAQKAIKVSGRGVPYSDDEGYLRKFLYEHNAWERLSKALGIERQSSPRNLAKAIKSQGRFIDVSLDDLEGRVKRRLAK
jgi:hypothetical protein